MLMWLLGAVGLAIELVAQFDPWALGMTDTVDPMIARTLFWWTGHPIESHSPLARVLEHLGWLTALTACITVAAYIPIFWPFATRLTTAEGWKVW